MEKTWFIITYLISSAIDICITVKYMNFFLGKLRVSAKRAVGTIILCYLLCSIQYIFFPIPLLNMITSFTALCIIAGCHEQKKNKILSAAVLVFLFQFVCELLVGFITGGGNTHLTLSGYYAETYQLISLCIVQFILYFIITGFKNVNSKLQLPTGFNIAIIILGVLLFLMEVIIFIQENASRNARRLSAFFVLFVIILVMYMYDIISRSYVNSFQAHMLERENMYYTKQAELLQKNNDNIRKIRHDMKNHLVVLKSLLKAESGSQKAEDYLEQMLGKFDKVKLYSTSGNMQLDSIVNYKLSEAYDRKIDIVSEVKLPETLEINMGDMVTILGNILDNAIEATEKLSDGRYIELNIKYKMGAIFITSKNSYDGNINSKNGVLKTRKSNRLEHGIGLNSVQEAVEKYNGEVRTEYDDREFCIRIILYTDNYC